MSWRVVGKVFERRFQSASAKLVMLALAEWCNDDDLALYPHSKAQFADTTQLSARQVQRLFAKLVEMGLVEIELEADAASRRPPKYRINIDRLLELPLTATAQADRARRQRKVRGDTVSPQGKTESRDRGDRESQRGDSVSPTIPVTPEDTPCAREAAPGGPTSRACPSNQDRSQAQCETCAQPEAHKTGDAVPRETEHARSAAAIWKDASEAIQGEIGNQAWRTWLKDIVPLEVSGDTLVLGAPSRFMANLVKTKFGELIERQTERRVEVRVHNSSVISTSQRIAAREREARESRAADVQATHKGKTGGHG